MKLSNYVFEKTHENVKEDAHEQEEEEEIETEFDYVLMLCVPFTAFLVGEALETCGFVPLGFICIALRLYAKPNLTKSRSDFLRLLTGWFSGFSKKIGYTMMGISLPLHFKHDSTSYTLAAVTVVALPILTIVLYFVLCRVFKKRSITNYYRCCSDCGILAYMLSLLTFEFRIMHFVLMVACISHFITDNIIIGVIKCSKMKEDSVILEDDNMSRFKIIK